MPTWYRRTGIVVLAGLWCAVAAAAQAQTCGDDYTMQDGDSLAKIAAKVYGKSSQWTLIFYANQDRFAAGQVLVTPGLVIRIPCLDTVAPTAKAPDPATGTSKADSSAPTVLSSEIKRIQFLTASDYAPFTDSALPNGGMLTDVVNVAMTEFKADTKAAFDFNIAWVNDWAAHLNPLLITRAFDMGFPWAKPNCQAFEELDVNAKYRCQKFFFSDPLFEEQTLVFLKKDSPIKMESESELVGKKLCRPTGYTTFDLDEQGRNWVKDKKVTLLSPPNVETCLRMLIDGTADAMPINEMTGRAAMIRLDLADKLRVIDKPISFITLHVIIAKSHPNARAMLYYVNAAIAKLKASGNYDQIVERHLQQFWDSQSEQAPKAKAAPAPAAAKATDSKTAVTKPADAKTSTSASDSPAVAASGTEKK